MHVSRVLCLGSFFNTMPHKFLPYPAPRSQFPPLIFFLLGRRFPELQPEKRPQAGSQGSSRSGSIGLALSVVHACNCGLQTWSRFIVAYVHSSFRARCDAVTEAHIDLIRHQAQLCVQGYCIFTEGFPEMLRPVGYGSW